MSQSALSNELLFEPSMAAAQARLAAVRPSAYAQSRNALEGAVTRLSPYITHGFLSLRQVLQAVQAKHALPLTHKFASELGWRAYFQHVWAHADEGIFASLHEGPLPESAYASALPRDLHEARTGIPAIDEAVRTLYASGYLHNHARMWLASYVVHVRRVHWRVGADWLYGHLLDGDLASNHLSWQWVAGTGSHKPYLFNADNVAKYAPLHWHSPGTCIDTSYAAMEAMARGGKLPRLGAAGEAVAEPQLLQAPPPECGFTLPMPNVAKGRRVQLIHPWSLGDDASDAADSSSGVLTIAAFPAELSARWPWSPARWQFVAQAMAARTPHLWFSDSARLMQALGGAESVQGSSNLHLPAAWQTLRLNAPGAFVKPPPRRCHSFSQYWNAVAGKLGSVEELLGSAGGQSGARGRS